MKAEEVFRRKRELAIRDPLYHALQQALSSVIQQRIATKKDYLLSCADDPVLNEISKLDPHYIFQNRHSFTGLDDSYEDKGEICRFVQATNVSDYDSFMKAYEVFHAYHQNKYPAHWKLYKLSGEIGSKWHVLVEIDFMKKEVFFTPYTHDEAIWVGSPPFDEYTTYNASEHYPQLRWTPFPNPSNKPPILADINEFTTPGYKSSGNWIPIVINASRLNEQSAKEIKKQVWEIIKQNLTKGQATTPAHEYPECAFLYSTRKDTFDKYLRWYDLHVQEKISFRLIAKIEKEPSKAGEILQKLKLRKIRWGLSIAGEDKVQKGAGKVFKAIHRKDYSPEDVQPVVDEYNCPTHGSDCSNGCSHLKEWEAKFNRLFPSNI